MPQQHPGLWLLLPLLIGWPPGIAMGGGLRYTTPIWWR